MKKLTTVSAILGLTFVLAGCTTTGSSSTNSNSTSTSAASAQTYTLADVSSHNTRNDCWMIISGKVYNVTAYVPTHPGGVEILQGCGKDATQLFATKGNKQEEHSNLATQTMAKYFIGELE